MSTGRGTRTRWWYGLVITTLGVLVLTVVIRVLVFLVFSSYNFHPFVEIWNCLVLVLFVIPSLSVLHVVCVAFVGPLIQLRFFPFSDDLPFSY